MVTTIKQKTVFFFFDSEKEEMKMHKTIAWQGAAGKNGLNNICTCE
jgi:hypothetical protein